MKTTTFTMSNCPLLGHRAVFLTITALLCACGDGGTSFQEGPDASRAPDGSASSRVPESGAMNEAPDMTISVPDTGDSLGAPDGGVSGSTPDTATSLRDGRDGPSVPDTGGAVDSGAEVGDPDGGRAQSASTNVVPGQAAVIGMPGVVTVSVPGQAISAMGRLSIERLASAPPTAPSVGMMVAGFAIELSGQPAGQPLQAPASLTFKLDPARLRADVTAAEAAWVVYWDPRNKTLVEHPAVVDPAAGTVSVSTTHFSNWWLYILGPGDVHGTSPHFSFRFPAAINIKAWGTTDPFEVMARVRAKLEAYYDAYLGAGFPALSSKVSVELQDSLEAGYGPLTGNIIVSSYNYSSDDTMLEHELAHELFHAFQGAQINMFSLDARRWFVEAAADYAADALAAHSGRMGKDIEGTWSWNPLGLVDGKHEYATSHFIAWLAARGKGLKALQDAVFGAWLTTDAGESAFAAAAAGAAGFARTFVDYIVWLEADPASPIAAQPFAGFSVTDLFSDEIRLDFASSTTPKLAAYTAGWSSPDERAMVWTAPPAGVAVEVRVLRGGSRAYAEKPVGQLAPMKYGDALLIVAGGEVSTAETLRVLVDPTPTRRQFSTEPVSGIVPYSKETCTYRYQPNGTVSWPYGTEVVSITNVPCGPLASGTSTPTCFGVEIAVRETIPGRMIELLPSLGGGPSCAFAGVAAIESQPLILDGASYAGTAVRIPASGGAANLWTVPRVKQFEDTGTIIHDVVLAELQLRVVWAK